MLNVYGIGRVAKEPEVRYSSGTSTLAIATFSIVNNRKDKDKTADFFNCVAFGKTAESIEKYIRKGTKIAYAGTLQNDAYTNKDGNKVTTTKIVVNEWEFAESKGETTMVAEKKTDSDGFMQIPEGSELDELLPFC